MKTNAKTNVKIKAHNGKSANAEAHLLGSQAVRVAVLSVLMAGSGAAWSAGNAAGNAASTVDSYANGRFVASRRR
jgi:hypothetical protein